MTNSHLQVRISSDLYGDELVKMLGDKFNIPDVSFAEYAVYQTLDDGEIHMLDETHNPVSQSLLWQDPSEGTFSLKKLPKGLQRVGGGPGPETAESTDSKGNTSNSTGTESSSAFMDDVLGPLLPFSEDDEDLLLSVMVSRQSGSGLGFKLTPSYLLQARLFLFSFSFYFYFSFSFSVFLSLCPLSFCLSLSLPLSLCSIGVLLRPHHALLCCSAPLIQSFVARRPAATTSVCSYRFYETAAVASTLLMLTLLVAPRVRDLSLSLLIPARCARPTPSCTKPTRRSHDS